MLPALRNGFSSDLITMVTPLRVKNTWLLLLSNQTHFSVTQARGCEVDGDCSPVAAAAGKGPEAPAEGCAWAWDADKSWHGVQR